MKIPLSSEMFTFGRTKGVEKKGQGKDKVLAEESRGRVKTIHTVCTICQSDDFRLQRKRPVSTLFRVIPYSLMQAPKVSRKSLSKWKSSVTKFPSATLLYPRFRMFVLARADERWKRFRQQVRPSTERGLDNSSRTCHVVPFNSKA